jgi:hypothetical protein
MTDNEQAPDTASTPNALTAEQNGPTVQLTDAIATLTVRAGRLGAQWSDVTTTMKELTTTVDHLKITARRNRRMIIALSVSFLLDISLTVFLVLLAQQQTHNTSAIQEVQTRTSQQVLCPLYKLLVESDNPRAAANYPQGSAVYNEAMTQIRRSYVVLQCQ